MERNILKNTMMEMTWCEIEEWAKKDAIVLFPIGIVEEHSRHLPVATDIYLAVDQAKRMAHAMNEGGRACVVAPPFYWGIAGVVTKWFPGTFSVSEVSVVSITKDILLGLERAGFRKVVSINAHGDPAHRKAFVRAFKEFNEEHELKARWLTFEQDLKYEGFVGEEDFVLALPNYSFDDLILCKEKQKDDFDVHAGAFETAAMNEAFPELVDMDVAKKLKATRMGKEEIEKWISGLEENKDVILDGHVGDPAFGQYMQMDAKKAYDLFAKQVADFYEK